MPPRGRLMTLMCFFFLIAVLLFVQLFWKKTAPAPLTEKPLAASPLLHHLESCPNRIDWLQNPTIKFPVRYARRDIVINPKPGTRRDSLTKINEPLIPEFQVINSVDDPNLALEHCKDPLMLDVPAFAKDPYDAFHIIFGFATLLDRLEDSIVFLERWIAYTHARLFVIAVGPDEKTPTDMKRMRELEKHMRGLGIDVTIVKPLEKGDNMPERYFSLAKLMYSNRNENTEWIALIDDDTFFPSMRALVSMLNGHDPTERWYIGAMSEEWWSVVRYGFMGFGGAGVFLSIPLAAVINEHYNDCRERSRAGAGDMRILECIKWNTDTKLTHIPGLHQIDLHGDRSGLFESGRMLLSLHHWKEGWWDEDGVGTWFPMSAMHLVADVCGECFLQRWQFGTDMIFSNGYSIATYPKGHLSRSKNSTDFAKVENTWVRAGLIEGSFNKGYDHYLGPLRPKLELEEEKLQYRFLEAVAVNGGVRQLYLHMGIDGDLDSLIEVFWIRQELLDNQPIPP